jgi:hypothetical protein
MNFSSWWLANVNANLRKDLKASWSATRTIFADPFLMIQDATNSAP